MGAIDEELKKSVEILGGYSGAPMTGSPILQEIKKMNTLLSSGGDGGTGGATNTSQLMVVDNTTETIDGVATNQKELNTEFTNYIKTLQNVITITNFKGWITTIPIIDGTEIEGDFYYKGTEPVAEGIYVFDGSRWLEILYSTQIDLTGYATIDYVNSVRDYLQNQIFQNATDIGINQVSITNLTNKNTEQDARLDALESRPVGTSGSMSMNQLVSEIVITDENQSIIFDNLDAIADGGYELIVEGGIPTTASFINIFLNEETDYQRSFIVKSSTSNTPTGGEDALNTLVPLNPSGRVFSNSIVSSHGMVQADYIRSDGYIELMKLFTTNILNNVTKIELRSSVASGIPIGTRISLYKRKTEIKPSLVQEVILDADATSIVFDNLDALVDGGYELIFNSGLSTIDEEVAISLYLNDDTTNSNYVRSYVGRPANSTIASANTQENVELGLLYANTFANLDFSIYYNGSFNGEWYTSNGWYYSMGGHIKQLVENVTKMELTTDVENGIPAGTKASLYRRKFNVVTSKVEFPVTNTVKDNQLATPTENGLMSASDKAKLDSLSLNTVNTLDQLPDVLKVVEALQTEIAELKAKVGE